ncbi:MAG TPA: hypothetical protein VHC67_08465 [Gaiellaceae bacterium]|nr:hypothetical protein [Gaiellaceae bacterium]
MAAVAALVLGGCGAAGAPTLEQRDVVHDFASAGIRLPICQPLFHTKDIECADSALMHMAPDAKLVDVQVLPDAKLAQYIVRTGGNMQDGKGHTYPPFARVANVVVTLVARPTVSERRQIERAVALLRSRLER